MLQCCLNFNRGICRGHLDYSRDLVVLIFQMMRSRLREGMCLGSRHSISDLSPHLLPLSLFFNILYSHTFATLRLYGHPSRWLIFLWSPRNTGWNAAGKHIIIYVFPVQSWGCKCGLEKASFLCPSETSVCGLGIQRPALWQRKHVSS